MRILVTGANGHLGCNLVRELLAREHDVVALVRPQADARGLQGLPVRIAAGDVLDPASVDAAADGADAIVNLAAVYRMGVTDLPSILRPAVEGIRNVLQVAAQRKIGRVVHTSSTVAVGTSDDPKVLLDERTFNERPYDAYYQAKTESERQAWALASELGVALVCVNPSGILGPYDYRTTPSSSYVEQLARGEAQTAPGAINYVHVRDVAWMHAEALVKGEPGERYLCVGPNGSMRELSERITALTGRRNPHFPLPRPFVLGYTWVVERFDRLRGVEPRTTYSAVAEVASRWAQYDPAKAQATFGYTPRPLDETLKDALRWAAFLGRVDPTGFTFDVTPDPSWVR